MTRTSPLDQVTYKDLYARWEAGNWSATEIDFSADREQWQRHLSDIERKAALWNYSLFFHGEDSVADNLSPYIDAAAKEEQKYFLATQQVDEARHAVFFDRFMREVVGVDATDVASALEATRPQLTWGFRKTFEILDRVSDELRRDRSRPKLAQAITMYHLIVEATLAQPAQHFIDHYLEERQLLPGFASGMKNVALDEQRHIGFGVKCLSELMAEDPACKPAVSEILQEVFTYTIGLFVPPNFDRRYTECFGFTLEDVYAEGFNSLDTKMRTAGIELREVLPYAPLELGPEGIAERAIQLLQAGYAGEKNGRAARDPESMQLLFDTVGRSINPKGVGQGLVIQWDFRDADPWYVQVDNGSTDAHPGRAGKADVTLRCAFDDWIDVVAGRRDPRRQMLRRKIRLRGSPLALYRMAQAFPR